MKKGKYQPSNGSEGTWFIDKHCMNCKHCDPDPCGDKQCDILCATMVYNVNQPEYPEEWTYNDKDEPICTKWSKWNWEEDGNPDDSDNPSYITPFNPNQTTIDF